MGRITKCPRCGSKNITRSTVSELCETATGSLVALPLYMVGTPFGKFGTQLAQTYAQEVGVRIGRALHCKMKCKDCKHCWDVKPDQI